MEDYSKISNNKEKLKELRNQLKETKENSDIDPNFLSNNDSLKDLKLPDMETNNSSSYVDTTDFLANNDSLKDLKFPNLKAVDSDFLSNNDSLKDLKLPNLDAQDLEKHPRSK